MTVTEEVNRRPQETTLDHLINQELNIGNCTLLAGIELNSFPVRADKCENKELAVINNTGRHLQGQSEVMLAV